MLERQTYPEPALIVYAPRRRLLLLGVASLVFVACGALFVLSADPLVTAVGVFCVLFFGLSGCYAAYRLVRRRPVLRVTTEGITESASPASVGFVPWSRVLDFGVTEMMGQRAISVFVDEPGYFLRHLSAAARANGRINIRMTGTPIHIMATLLPIPAEEMLEEIAAFLPPGGRVADEPG